MGKGFWKGTSRLEIVFYGAFIGLLIVLSWPHYEDFQCRAMQSEAIASLYDAYNVEKMLYAQTGTYEPIEALIESHRFLPQAKRYTYKTKDLGEKSFSIEATGHSEVNKDFWRIDEKQNLVHVIDVCKL